MSKNITLRCNRAGCKYETCGTLDFVSRAIAKHEIQHKHDADLVALGFKALGIPNWEAALS